MRVDVPLKRNNTKALKARSQDKKNPNSKEKEEEELRWLYADNYDNMVHQGHIPGTKEAKESPIQADAIMDTTGTESYKGDQGPSGEQNLEQEVLEALWIKPDDIDLQWKMGRLSNEDHWEGERRLKTYSETYLSRKMKLLGHVVRAEDDHPMRQVTFKSGRVEELNVGKRRMGKPKLDWVRQGKIQVWKEFRAEIDQSHTRNPEKRRKHKGNLSQDINLITWAMDKKH